MKKDFKPFQVVLLTLLLTLSCSDSTKAPPGEAISSMNLKRGKVVVCGSPDKEFGTVSFTTSCSEKTKEDFDLAIALLHSFEYDEAEKMFAKVIDNDPRCAMAFWGVAMSNYHLLWMPPSAAELEKGSKAIAIAKELAESKKETEYIEAAGQLYNDWQQRDHKTRCLDYEQAMEKLYRKYPGEKEAAALYALALNASADPTDTSFTKQRKAGKILDDLYSSSGNHPGIVHYIIHTYDNPQLASIALPAARRYAAVAPSSAHALHMPSHIFIRLGLWDEAIQSNLASVSSAKCYAEQTGITGHWDEELHGLDYLVYAYLQKGDNNRAREQWNYLKKMKEVNPVNFKVAYAFAAIPSRYMLENRAWNEAARLSVPTANFEWRAYPWQKAMIHFTRVLGSVHMNQIDSARKELDILTALHDTLVQQKNSYSAGQVQIQIKTSTAWILCKEGKKQEALALMKEAADIEDRTQKHPVTPCEVLPARELLGEMLLELNEPVEALLAFEADLKKNPNRFNGLYGAGVAAEKCNNLEKATTYYQQLIQVAANTNSERPELEKVKKFLQKST